MDEINSKFLNLNLKDVSGAVISAVLVAIVGYLSTVTDITDIDFKMILNIAFLTGITSLLKSIATTKEGRFAGIIKIK